MKLSTRQLATAWFEALQESAPAEWSGISQRMLRHLYIRGQLRRLREIVRAMSVLEHERQGTTPVTVRLAHALPEPLIAQAVQRVLPNIRAVIESVQAPAVLGGLQIETPNQRFDLSIQARLHQLTNIITH